MPASVRATLKSALLVLVLGSGLAVSCSDDDPPSCSEPLADGTCVGVTRSAICSDTYCTADVSCGATLFVRDGGSGDGSSEGAPLGSLAEAAKRARAGDCIALAAGRYEGGAIPAGVSVLGVGADEVTISAGASAAALLIKGGSDATLRGFTVKSAKVGIALDGTTKTRVEQVRISAAAGVGIDARAAKQLVLSHVSVVAVAKLASSSDAGVGGDAGGDAGGASADAGVGGAAGSGYGIGLLVAASSDATIDACDVDGAGTQGVLVHGSRATISASRVRNSGLYGIAIDCGAACPAGGSRVERSAITNNAAIGVLAIGGEIALASNDIGATRYGAGFARNVQLQGAKLDVRDNTVHDSVGQGLVVDGCSGEIANNTISSNQDRGAVVQSVTAALTLRDNQLVSNERAGLTVIGGTSVVVRGGEIRDTKKRVVLVGTKSASIGDGVQLLSTSAEIDGVRVSGNQRVGVLVDDAKATISNTVIDGSAELLVVQNAKTSDQTLSNNSDGAGKAIAATQPPAPFVNDPGKLISTLPLPIP